MQSITKDFDGEHKTDRLDSHSGLEKVQSFLEEAQLFAHNVANGEYDA